MVTDAERVRAGAKDLAGANLARTYLARAYLNGANLAGADLNRANLTGAYLTRADLTRADLNGAVGVVRVGPLPVSGRDAILVDHGEAGVMVQVGCWWGSLIDCLAVTSDTVPFGRDGDWYDNTAAERERRRRGVHVALMAGAALLQLHEVT